jgi:hypothetical protein
MILYEQVGTVFGNSKNGFVFPKTTFSMLVSVMEPMPPPLQGAPPWTGKKMGAIR